MIGLTEAFAGASIPAEAEEFRAQVKSFLASHLPDRPSHTRARTWSAYDAQFSRSLAERGWVGLTLPTQYGGGGRDAFARFVLVEELLIAGAPVAAHWIGDRQSGPLILRYGTEAQRQYYLPRICRGEIFFCIGMSEPNAGSDLASVRTRATEDRRRMAAERVQDLDDLRAQIALHARPGSNVRFRGRSAGGTIAIDH